MRSAAAHRNAFASLLIAVACSAAWAACTGTSAGDGDDDGGGGSSGDGRAGRAGGPGSSGAGGGGGPGAGGAGGGAGAAGLPCDVQTFLTANCASCHKTPLAGGAPMPLTTYDELVAENGGGARFADRALARIKEGTMPPGVTYSSPDQYKAFEEWVVAGAVPGECGGGPGGADLLDAAPVCTSGANGLACEAEDGDRRGAAAVPGDGPGCEVGERMNPGRACVSCHSTQDPDDAPVLAFGGTVYPTGHEPDLCDGGPTNGAAEVVVIDANGAEFARPVNEVGNFLLRQSDAAGLAFPIRAKVVYRGRERAMATPQDSGDCNACHTQNGANGAPGRITLPQ